MILQIGNGKWGKNHQRMMLVHNIEHYAIDIEQDYMAAISEYSPNAVIITTNSVNHFPIAADCMAAGIPVFCEKPVCVKPNQVQELKYYRDQKPIFMSGHQLCFDPDLQGIKGHGVNYINSQRTGAIPRDEGAILSLAVHDVAVAQYLFDAYRFEIEHVSGNLHNAKIVLRYGKSIVEILVQSFANIKLRYMTLVYCGDLKKVVYPDHWYRTDLLEAELLYFFKCVAEKKQPDINSLDRTIIVMETIFKIMEELDGSKTV